LGDSRPDPDAGSGGAVRREHVPDIQADDLREPEAPARRPGKPPLPTDGFRVRSGGVMDPGAEVRQWLLSATTATLCTLAAEAEIAGWPFGSLAPFALGRHAGRPALRAGPAHQEPASGSTSGAVRARPARRGAA